MRDQLVKTLEAEAAPDPPGGAKRGVVSEGGVTYEEGMVGKGRGYPGAW